MNIETKYYKAIILIFIISISFPLMANAEYCFQIPDDQTHQDSKAVNEAVFQIGVNAYKSFLEVENQNFDFANSILEDIKKDVNRIKELYIFIERYSNDRTINPGILSSTDRDRYINLLEMYGIQDRRSIKDILKIGVKEIELFEGTMNNSQIRYVSNRDVNFSNMNKIYKSYNRLVRIGFMISKLAYRYEHIE